MSQFVHRSSVQGGHGQGQLWELWELWDEMVQALQLVGDCGWQQLAEDADRHLGEEAGADDYALEVLGARYRPHCIGWSLPRLCTSCGRTPCTYGIGDHSGCQT